ncbi:MAG: peptidylprolyl isomerase [Casimicrobiaceae bacterium]|nr:peptidylprolyl isomerase [Casimicrobiaceae bacterium]
MARVRLQTSLGSITLEIDELGAPKTAANFLEYVRSGHYDGTIFHRVIRDFVIQGGGFTPGMHKKPTRPPIPHEGKVSSAAGLRNARGTIAMARTSEPHSASCQFFINVVDNAFLDFKEEASTGWGYVVFGRVVEGMDVVDRIRAVATTRVGPHNDVPVEDVVIERATVL